MSQVTQQDRQVPQAPAAPATVKHTCGHAAPFRELPGKDNYRNQRYAKERGRPCPECRQKREAARQEQVRARKTVRKEPLYPPTHAVGLCFHLRHVGVGQWSGFLSEDETGVQVGEKCEAPSMRGLIRALNLQVPSQAPKTEEA